MNHRLHVVRVFRTRTLLDVELLACQARSHGNRTIDDDWLQCECNHSIHRVCPQREGRGKMPWTILRGLSTL